MMPITIRAALLLAVGLAVVPAVVAQDFSPYASKDAWQMAVPEKYQGRPEFAFIEANPSLPRVLLIGDSISMCYTADVRQRLKGVANVFRAPDNCRSTRQTVEHIETYLGNVPWDVIHFNWGIHDVTHVNDAGIAAPPPEGKLQVPPDQYRRNLRQLIERLKKTEARLIWASITPVGNKAEKQGYRRDRDVVAYNAIAAEVMAADVVGTHDLYALTKPRAEELLSDGVHPNSEGSKVCADSVAAVIRQALGEPQEKDGVPPLESLSRNLLGISDETRSLLAEGQRRGLIEVAAVNLPVHPQGDCNHYGWPIATHVGDTIIVMHRRIPGHRKPGSGEPNEKMSYGIVLRSEDGGKTWSEPYDLRDCMLPEDRNRGGLVPLSHRFKFDEANESTEGYKIHLHAIGTTRDDAVVAINNHGVFRSEDMGRTWNHFSKALRDDTFPHHIVNIGPNIIDHPDHGLLVFGNWSGKVEGPQKNDELVVLRSWDGGELWKVDSYDAGFQQYEPAACLQDGRFLFVTRDQTTGREHQQMAWSPGETPTATRTNMKDPYYVDTVDFSFNPITKRFEVIRSERYHMQLWLWSIAPKDWLTGEWRRECRLLARNGTFYRDADGFHPAGAVIDTKRGVQHIFIYSGHPNGPAGVFRISRTLDTPKLSAFLGPTNDPARMDTICWTGGSSSNRWNDPANWDLGVPDSKDVAVFESISTGESVVIDQVADVGRIELRLPDKSNRLLLAGSGTLRLHGAETLPNKYSVTLITTGMLDIQPELTVEIRNQRFIAGNRDGTIVIRSDRVRAGVDGLKAGITDRGRFVLATRHWEPGMSRDLSASHTQGPKVFDLALSRESQGVTFTYLIQHDGDPIEIHGFEPGDFLRFGADPFTSCEQGKEFRIEAVSFAGWPNNGKASVERRCGYWDLKPAAVDLPDEWSLRATLRSSDDARD